MTGSGLLLTERDKRVIAEVARFGAMTRHQMQHLGLFSSATRAKARLKRLADAKYLDARRQPIAAGGPRSVYLLSRCGSARRALGGVSDLFLTHQLGLVDIRIAFEQFTQLTTWRADRELAGLKVEVVADAYLEYQVGPATFCAFVEYDRGTEPLGRIEKKARGYLDLAYSGKFARSFNRKFFRVLVVVESTARLMNLSQTVARLTDRIFRFCLLSELTERGPLVSIWRRPGSTTLESFTES